MARVPPRGARLGDVVMEGDTLTLLEAMAGISKAVDKIPPTERREVLLGACQLYGVLPASATWPWVLAFAHLMERKLDKNRHKGDREGWVNDSASSLFERLDQELDELKKAWAEGRAHDMPDEAADVGNFAMMIADAAGGLKRGGR